MIEGATIVDAYVVNNDEVKAYIEAREANILKVKAFLESKGYEADRSYFGSEDGEAILYRKKRRQRLALLMSLRSNVCWDWECRRIRKRNAGRYLARRWIGY
mgnify:CR=1 FL=1